MKSEKLKKFMCKMIKKLILLDDIYNEEALTSPISKNYTHDLQEFLFIKSYSFTLVLCSLVEEHHTLKKHVGWSTVFC